jgi:hypothetical protein
MTCHGSLPSYKYVSQYPISLVTYGNTCKLSCPAVDNSAGPSYPTTLSCDTSKVRLVQSSKTVMLRPNCWFCKDAIRHPTLRQVLKTGESTS